jgi:hypothetical protein
MPHDDKKYRSETSGFAWSGVEVAWQNATRQLLYEVAARQLWLTALVLLEGRLWCTALDRIRAAVRLSLWTWGIDRHTLVLSKECPSTILILHKPCLSAPQPLAG